MRAILLLIALLIAPGAFAAEIAEARILGFSPDAGTFAFEEFGVQDGSGFPYSNIYVINTKTDSWLPGTPFRVQLTEEGSDLAEARAQALEAAAELLSQTSIGDRWRVLAHSPLGEYEASPILLAFGLPKPWNALADIDERYVAEIDIFHTATPGEDCAGITGEPPNGFRLELRNLSSGGEKVLHEDDEVPQSRGCPITYRITAVVAPDLYPVETVVVLMSVFRVGFEGPDRRFLAVAGTLPD